MRHSLVLVLSTAALAQQYLPPPEVAPVQLASKHPRLGRHPEQVRALYRSDAVFKSIFEPAIAAAADTRDPATAAAAWAATGEDRYATKAAELLLNEPITRTGDGGYSRVWAFALAWDWLHGHAALAGEAREKAAQRIVERLQTELEWLDGRYMATWHGRNQAANGAMVAALAVGDLPGQERNLARAAAHYADALRALRFSEGWPEGPSYWIYNRAAPYALAADCYITATGSDTIAGIAIRDAIRTIGLWTLYQFAPNRVFEPYGDSAGSLRLGETGWWEITMDYFARVSRDASLAAGADWFRKISPSPYGRSVLRWWAALSYSPTTHEQPEQFLRSNLPQAQLFGRRSMGVAFFRGEWGNPDELFASFKAGDLLAHHDHYDAGHFSIQHGGLLAPLTGIYGDAGGYYGAYRLGYAIQTVASNSLLVLAPGEASNDLRNRKEPAWTALSGGQRVIRSTGFDCLSPDHFEAQRNSGPHLERADITAFESVPGRYDYIAADITAAYNSTRWAEPGSQPKVSLVTRQFLYLRPERAFVVYDRVETTRPEYLPKVLLHALAKPVTASEKLLTGPSEDNGILESFDRRFKVSHQRGVLTAVSLLPEKTRTLKIGGRDYYAYVEADGDQADGFDGVKLAGGDPMQPRDTKQLGLWRVEIEPAEPGTSRRFLTVLLPRLADEQGALPEVELVDAGERAHAVRIGETTAVFAREAAPIEEISLRAAARGTILLDAKPRAAYTAAGLVVAATPEGVLTVDLGGRRSQSIRVRR